MPGRPRAPEPTSAELEARVLDALRAAGGSAQRNSLRSVIRPVMSTADFDRTVEALAASGKLRAEQVTSYWRSHHNQDLPHRAIVYSLAPPGRRKPSKLPPRPAVAKPSAKPELEGPELEERILAALRESGGALSRSELRDAIGRLIRTPAFESAINGLIAAGAITGKLTTRERLSIRGHTARSTAMIYTLTNRRKRAK
jgi:hypothetical protein